MRQMNGRWFSAGFALVGGIALYLLVEGGLDIATDMISHKIIKNKERKERGEW